MSLMRLEKQAETASDESARSDIIQAKPVAFRESSIEASWRLPQAQPCSASYP